MKIVDFNAQRIRTRGSKMNKSTINEIIKQRKDNGKSYKTSEMEIIASDILNSDDKMNRTITQIVKIAEDMGFHAFQQKMKKSLSGKIEIDEKHKKKYGTDHVIFTNIKDHPYQQRFVIAHELGHFLFDYDHRALKYYDTYKKNDHETESERRANAFAANILMPKKEFIHEYNRARKINSDPEFITICLMSAFKVPEKAVIKRIYEVSGHA